MDEKFRDSSPSSMDPVSSTDPGSHPWRLLGISVLPSFFLYPWGHANCFVRASHAGVFLKPSLKKEVLRSEDNVI